MNDGTATDGEMKDAQMRDEEAREARKDTGIRGKSVQKVKGEV